MQNQYCKVGAITPMDNEEQSVALLEYLYQDFAEKASNIEYANTRLGEFFASKAKKIEKLLNEL